jgi:hypothetical protein
MMSYPEGESLIELTGPNLKLKYRAPNPRGKNRSDYNGHSGKRKPGHDRLVLAVIKEEKLRQARRQVQMCLHILPDGKRRFEIIGRGINEQA